MYTARSSTLTNSLSKPTKKSSPALSTIEQFHGTMDTYLNMLIDFFDNTENLLNSLANIKVLNRGSWKERKRKRMNVTFYLPGDHPE